MMSYRVTPSVLVVLAGTLGGLLYLGSASAAPIEGGCSLNDATATGDGGSSRTADECKVGDPASSPESETAFVNQSWPDGFAFIGKWDFENEDRSLTRDEESDVDGLQFIVSELNDEDTDYDFSYQVIGTDDWAGVTIDWVLGIKDGAERAGGGFAAYLWREITLDIDGQFSSFFREPDVFSHASGFVRRSDDLVTPEEIPAPASLALLGLGLGLMGLMLRGRSRRRA